MRGLCLDSKHDTVYFFQEGIPGEMPYFKGISSSVITWNSTRNNWVLNHLRYTAPAYLEEESLVRNLNYSYCKKDTPPSTYEKLFKTSGLSVYLLVCH